MALNLWGTVSSGVVRSGWGEGEAVALTPTPLRVAFVALCRWQELLLPKTSAVRWGEGSELPRPGREDEDGFICRVIRGGVFLYINYIY